MIKLGITGGMGSGKSYVSRIFEAMGYPVFDADLETRKLYLREQVKQEVIHLLGADAYRSNGTPDTSFIASVVFANTERLKMLEAILHPLSRKLFDEFVLQHAHASLLLKEAAILFERGADAGLDKVLLVKAPLEERIKRCLKRNPALCRDDVMARINSQWPEAELEKRSDFVVVNDGVQMLLPQVLRVLKELKQPA